MVRVDIKRIVKVVSVRLASLLRRTLLHNPSAMARHALCTNEFKIRLRLQQQDPAVRVGSHTNLRRFLQESTTSCHTGIPWRDLSCCFGHGHSIIRRY